jgi:hypothetical protein
MTVEGADVAELRSAATQFSKGASALESSTKALHSLITTTTQWRGPDADRFRSQWSSVSARTIAAAVASLNEAANTLRRNADEQEKASSANSGDTAGADLVGSEKSPSKAPVGLNGLWNEIHDIPKHSSGYRVQEVIGPDKTRRYIVYIAGTSAADGQHWWDNIPAAAGVPDDKQLAALRAMIPKGADVMLVGYSQGGMDAQNIAMQKNNGFNVSQVVTFGSPVRSDLDVPAIDLQADGDPTPGDTNGLLASPFVWNSTGSNPNAHIYQADSHVSGSGYDIHEKAYGYLSQKWDEANFDPAKGVAAFQGDVISTVDLGVNGAAIQ